MSGCPHQYPSYDGSGNNLRHKNWGKANTKLVRKCPSAYTDGKSKPAIRGKKNPNPRKISNAFCFEDGNVIYDNHGLSNMFWMWGQFIDHELDLTLQGTTNRSIEKTQDCEVMPELMTMKCPSNDPILPNATIQFSRSLYDHSTGSINPREHINVNSSFIDGSNTYGSDTSRAYHLRTLDGTGHLKTSIGQDGSALLSLNIDKIQNDNGPNPHADPKDFFLAGDIRSNENVFLMSMQTLFVREHNFIADELVKEHPDWIGNDELIYQEARKIVVAEMQVICYYEFWSALFGGLPCKLRHYKYDEKVNASVATEFSTVAYRVGHTMLSDKFNVDGKQLTLQQAFFNPRFVKKHGIDGLLKAGFNEPMRRVDGHIVEDVRSFLFRKLNSDDLTEDSHLHSKTKQMLDLACLNIQRGRDHGIADYNSLREAYGLKRVSCFCEITSDIKIQRKLAKVYGNVDCIDPWIGGLLEDTQGKSVVGPLFYKILEDQFSRCIKGDRYWFKNVKFSKRWKKHIYATRLSDIIKRNTEIKNVPDDVFHLSSH